MTKKPKLEWRMVCRLFGTQGHNAHHKTKATKAKARQAVIDQNHHAQMHPDSFYAKEADWRLQSRTVTEWEDTDE